MGKKTIRLLVMTMCGLLVIGGTIVSASTLSSLLPAGKQEIENNYKKLRQTSKPAIKSSDVSLKPVQHDKLPEGVLSEFTAPFHSEDVIINSVWQRQIDGKLVQVYAGVQSTDKQQGLVILHVTEPDGFTVSERRFVTAEKHGALKIENENHLKLAITSEAGVSYEYDVVGKKLYQK